MLVTSVPSIATITSCASRTSAAGAPSITSYTSTPLGTKVSTPRYSRRDPHRLLLRVLHEEPVELAGLLGGGRPEHLVTVEDLHGRVELGGEVLDQRDRIGRDGHGGEVDLPFGGELLGTVDGDGRRHGQRRARRLDHVVDVVQRTRTRSRRARRRPLPRTTASARLPGPARVGTVRGRAGAGAARGIGRCARVGRGGGRVVARHLGEGHPAVWWWEAARPPTTRAIGPCSTPPEAARFQCDRPA